MGVMTVFVKAPDTTFLQFLTLFCAFVGETTWVNWTLPDLTLSLESLLAGSGTTLTTIATGAVGAVILLIVTVPPTADEWPDAVPGMIQGDEILIVVEGSYGQGHIEQRAQSDDKCIASSHQAILNDRQKLNTSWHTVKNISLLRKLFKQSGIGICIKFILPYRYLILN